MTLDLVQKMILLECFNSSNLYKSNISEFEYYFLGLNSNEIPKSKSNKTLNKNSKKKHTSHLIIIMQ